MWHQDRSLWGERSRSPIGLNRAETDWEQTVQRFKSELGLLGFILLKLENSAARDAFGHARTSKRWRVHTAEGGQGTFVGNLCSDKPRGVRLVGLWSQNSRPCWLPSSPKRSILQPLMQVHFLDRQVFFFFLSGTYKIVWVRDMNSYLKVQSGMKNSSVAACKAPATSGQTLPCSMVNSPDELALSFTNSWPAQQQSEETEPTISTELRAAAHRCQQAEGRRSSTAGTWQKVPTYMTCANGSWKGTRCSVFIGI